MKMTAGGDEQRGEGNQQGMNEIRQTVPPTKGVHCEFPGAGGSSMYGGSRMVALVWWL